MNPRLKQLISRGIPGSRKALRELSEKKWLLCEGESRQSPPAIYLEGDLERVTQVMEDTTLERELGRIHGGITEHAATVAYQLADVDIFEGSLYKGSVRHPLLRKSDVSHKKTEVLEIEAASLASTFYGSFYFGHWMTDDLTLHLAAESVGNPVTIARKRYGHEPAYCELFGIQPTFVERAKCAQVVIFDDFGQNKYKRERYELLRSRLRSSIKSKGNSRVFIRRGSSGATRSLVNFEAVEKSLMTQGFVIVDPERLTVEQIIEQTLGAELVVGVEGSHLTHGLFAMADGGTLCTLQPPYRFNNWYKDFTDCLGMRYACMTGTTVEGGFTVDTERLERLMEKIEIRAQV